MDSDSDAETAESTPHMGNTKDPVHHLIPGPLAERHWVQIDPAHQDKDDKLDPSEMAHFIRANIAGSSDDEHCDQGLVNTVLYPVFCRPCPSKPTLGKRQHPSGHIIKHYCRPILDPITGKLISRPNSSSTKSNFKTYRENAIGKNNNIMANWLGPSQVAPTSTPFPNTTSSIASTYSSVLAHHTNNMSGSTSNSDSDLERRSQDLHEESSDTVSLNFDVPSEITEIDLSNDFWINSCVDQH